MGISERKIRVKEETRKSILGAALDIARQEGWQALSMRKIADMIEYSATTIYEHFDSKDDILLVLTKAGFQQLNESLKSVTQQGLTAVEIIESMWLNYWQFAVEHKEVYQLMFGVETYCPGQDNRMPEAIAFADLFKTVIRTLMAEQDITESAVAAKFYCYWSLVHGLIAINLVNKGSEEIDADVVFHDAIRAISQSITR